MRRASSRVRPPWPALAPWRTDVSALDLALERARASITPRVVASDLEAELAAGALVVDIRPAALRERDGELPGATVVERNVLEWRLDPERADRLAALDGPDRRVVVVCDEGYASSLAAAQLRELGIRNATDLAGGYQAWRTLRIRKNSFRLIGDVPGC
jgi:rhodanese-related sulfurtransferase